jgi:hypothetical protein
MKSKFQRSLFEDEAEPVSLSSKRSASEIAKQESLPPIRQTPLPAPEQWMISEKVDDCGWVAFSRQHGRVPQLTDAKKPWEYPGWLMHYRLLLEEHLEIPARWDYWFRTMVAGRLLDEPIPQIHFTDGGERSRGYKLVEGWIRLIDRYEGGWSSPMPVLLDWLLWGFGLSKEQPALNYELEEQLYRNVNLAPLLLEPQDYFGGWIANQKGNWNPHAFYPSPLSLVELMAQMNFAGMDWREARSKTVCDPCMGSGRILIVSASYSLRLFGTDIDNELLRAAKVNGVLYAPWLVRPFPECFFPSPQESPSGDTP